MHTKELKTAIHAALKAGEAIMEIYETDDFEVEVKSDNSPLTKADKAAHLVIVNGLKGLDIPILSEEGKDIPYDERKNWKQLWIVDPIDGTKEFIKRNGEFTVNIALIENNIPVVGVIYVPAQKRLYFGNKAGAYLVEDVTASNSYEVDLSAKKLPQSTTLENKKFTIVASKSHLSPETEEFIEQMRIEKGEVETISKGSSLKLCMVAEGVADCYPRFAPTMEWDTAAGQAICMSAGCDVVDWTTKETMKYNRENLLNNWFLVTKSK